MGDIQKQYTIIRSSSSKFNIMIWSIVAIVVWVDVATPFAFPVIYVLCPGPGPDM